MDNYVSWAELKEKFGKDYPDDFWLRMTTEYPEGRVRLSEGQKPNDATLRSALNTLLSWHKSNPLGEAGYQRTGVAGWQDATRGYAAMYLNWVKNSMDAEVARGTINPATGKPITPEEVTALFAQIQAEVTQYGLHSGLEGVKESGVWSQWIGFLDRYGERLETPEGGKVLRVGGTFYNDDGSKIPWQEQVHLTDMFKQQKEFMEERQKNLWDAYEESAKQGISYTAGGRHVVDPTKQLKDYFELQKLWASPEMEAHRSILTRDEPHGRTEYDIVVAQNAEEARRLGYTSYIPESSWNSPQVQDIYQSELLKNLTIQMQRLDLFRAQKTGTKKPASPRDRSTPVPVHEKIPEAEYAAAGFWDKYGWLSESEKNMARQMARKTALETAGGAQPAGIMVRGERSPLWHTDSVTGERVQGAWVMSPGEYQEYKKKKAGGTATYSRPKSYDLEKAYMRFVKPGEDTADWESKDWEGVKIPPGYESREKAPPGMAPFLPGQIPGQPLRMGHQIPAFSGQQWLQMSPSQRAFMEQYVGQSRQVMGKKTKLKPWEDLIGQMHTGLPGGGIPGTRFTPARQRA